MADGAPLTAALASRWKDVGFRKGGFYPNLAPSLSGPMTSTPPFVLPCSQPKRSWWVLQSVTLHVLARVSLAYGYCGSDGRFVIKTHGTSSSSVIPPPPPSSGIQIILCDVVLTSDFLGGHPRVHYPSILDYMDRRKSGHAAISSFSLIPLHKTPLNILLWTVTFCVSSEI